MIKAAFITPALYWGGAERWMLTLARETAGDLHWVGCAVIEEMFLADNMVSRSLNGLPTFADTWTRAASGFGSRTSCASRPRRWIGFGSDMI